MSGETVNVCQSTKCPKSCNKLPEGARLNHFWELRKPWELDPRQYNFEGGLHPAFQLTVFSPKALSFKWRPILDLSKLNLFLKVEKFKLETPETLRTSLQQGEWVTSIDFKDAYFRIQIQEQSGNILRFRVQGQMYQFKGLPFGLSTGPMEFTVVAKEVKLMAIHKGIRIHQYLDD